MKSAPTFSPFTLTAPFWTNSRASRLLAAQVVPVMKSTIATPADKAAGATVVEGRSAAISAICAASSDFTSPEKIASLVAIARASSASPWVMRVISAASVRCASRFAGSCASACASDWISSASRKVNQRRNFTASASVVLSQYW